MINEPRHIYAGFTGWFRWLQDWLKYHWGHRHWHSDYKALTRAMAPKRSGISFDEARHIPEALKGILPPHEEAPEERTKLPEVKWSRGEEGGPWLTDAYPPRFGPYNPGHITFVAECARDGHSREARRRIRGYDAGCFTVRYEGKDYSVPQGMPILFELDRENSREAEGVRLMYNPQRHWRLWAEIRERSPLLDDTKWVGDAQ